MKYKGVSFSKTFFIFDKTVQKNVMFEIRKVFQIIKKLFEKYLS